MATKPKAGANQSEQQANQTEPNEGVTHDSGSAGATGSEEARAASGAAGHDGHDAENGVLVGRGKYLKDLDSMEVVIDGVTYREGDRVSESFLDSDANKAPTGGKYLVKKGGQ